MLSFFQCGSPKLLLISSITRIGFYGLYCAAAFGPTSFTKSDIGAPVYVSLITVLLGFTNGYCTANLFIEAPRRVHVVNAEKVEMLMVWFLLLAHAGRDEVEAAPSTRDRRESKSEAQQNFDPISLNDRKAHFGQTDNFARGFQQQNQQLRVQAAQPQFQQEQARAFPATPTQNSAAFPDVFNAHASQFQQNQIPPQQQRQQQQQQQQRFQTQFSQQPQSIQPSQSFQRVPGPNQFGAAPQAQTQTPALSLSAGPGSGRSLFDQIVNRINSGHREKARRKQSNTQSQAQPRPSNPFSDPTIAQPEARIPQSPNFPRVNPTIPDPPVQVVRQNPVPQRPQPLGIPQTNQQSSRNLGLALFGKGNPNRFGATSTQRPPQPFFTTEAVPNKNILEEQRQKELEQQRLRNLEEQRRKSLKNKD